LGDLIHEAWRLYYAPYKDLFERYLTYLRAHPSVGQEVVKGRGNGNKFSAHDAQRPFTGSTAKWNSISHAMWKGLAFIPDAEERARVLDCLPRHIVPSTVTLCKRVRICGLVFGPGGDCQWVMNRNTGRHGNTVPYVGRILRIYKVPAPMHARDIGELDNPEPLQNPVPVPGRTMQDGAGTRGTRLFYDVFLLCAWYAVAKEHMSPGLKLPIIPKAPTEVSLLRASDIAPVHIWVCDAPGAAYQNGEQVVWGAGFDFPHMGGWRDLLLDRYTLPT
jgi:hypothetical protein